MIAYALKHVRKRPVGSALTVLGIAVMTTLIIVITGIVQHQKLTANEHASASAGKIHVQTMVSGSEYPARSIDLPDDVADGILSRTDIQSSLSAKVLYYALQPPRYPNEPPALILVGIEPGKEEAFTGAILNDVKPASGTEFFPGGDPSPCAILGSEAARRLSAEAGAPIAPGSTVRVLNTELPVIGVLERSADKAVNAAILVPLRAAQDLLGKRGFVSEVSLIPEKAMGADSIAAEILCAHPRLVTVTGDSIRKNVESGITVFERMVDAVAMVVFVCASLFVVALMMSAVGARRREIGVLRAIGASSAMIVWAVIWEILILCAAGCLVGGLLSTPCLLFLLDANIFDPIHVLSYMPIAFPLALVSGIVPAIAALRVSPIEALRHE